jgi:hypothetical protein
MTSRCLPLDRARPTRRPPGTPAGTQRWRELLFVHWSLPPAAIRSLVPPGLELDLWDGRAWIGLVPFKMEAIRSSWMPARAGLDFLETNLRTYVHRDGEPGVWFFSLEASSWLAVRVARLGWSLPYFLAEMSSARDRDRIDYRSRRSDGVHASASWTIGDELGPSTEGTLEHFLLERYLLFSQRRGRLRKGQVHHPPYPARRATLEAIDESLLRAAGIDREGRAPDAVHYSEGVDVEVFGPWDLTS